MAWLLPAGSKGFWGDVLILIKRNASLEHEAYKVPTQMATHHSLSGYAVREVLTVSCLQSSRPHCAVL